LTVSERKINLAVNSIDGHLVESRVGIPDDLRSRALNDANGRFFSVGSSAKYQNGLCQWTVHNNFVMNIVIGETVHGPT
jgi:hypothetical protein